MKKIRFKKSGQSLVEFALIAPILILIIIAILEFALLLNQYLIVQSTAREVVRFIAVGADAYEAITAVESHVKGIDFGQLVITISPSEALRKRGTPVTVTCNYDYDIITPILGLIIGNTQHWTLSATMRME